VIQKLIDKGYSDNMNKYKDVKVDSNNELKELIHKYKKILDKLKYNTYELCIHALGCRVIQKIIETMPHEILKH